MKNLIIIHDNAADRCTSLTASNTSGTLYASNMLNDLKGLAHRSTGTSVSYTLTWTNPQSVGGVGLPATNLTAEATIRVRLYSDTAGTTLVADSGTKYACPGLNLGMWDWTQPLNANAFAYGGASKSAVWFETHFSVRRCVIDLVDTTNPAGYIDCSRLVVGAYWSPKYNADYGATVSIADTTQSQRNDAGDLLPNRGTQHDTMTFSLSMLLETDRARLMQIFRGVGTRKNVFISLMPESTDIIAEQDYMLYGKRSNANVSADRFNIFGSQMELAGW